MSYEHTRDLLLLFFTQAGLLMATYFRLKRTGSARAAAIKEEVRAAVIDLKRHQDVSVQKLNGMLSYLVHSFGRPAWIKVARTTAAGETEFRMLELNEEYASTFGIPRLDYIGKTDLEAGWPLHVANEFRKHDLAVWASGEPLTVCELIAGRPLRFRKIRVQTPDGDLKGIFAYAVDCADPETCPTYGKAPAPSQ